MQWIYKYFDALTGYEMYSLLQLRSEVFVVEQTCIFLDMDGKDEYSFHLLGFDERRLAACSRIVPPGIIYPEVAIGRVATHPDYRQLGIGRELMVQSLSAIEKEYGPCPVRIGAQLYLKKFYEGFGFIQVGEIYDEDGIDHVIMLRQ